MRRFDKSLILYIFLSFRTSSHRLLGLLRTVLEEDA